MPPIGVRWLSDAAVDARYAGRALARTPLVSAVMLLTLAIGIGASAAIFSVLDALVLRTLPVANPDRLVLAQSASGISFNQFGRLRSLTDQFSSLAAVWTFDRFNIVTDPGTPAQREVPPTHVGLATAQYFSTLGVSLAQGRAFTDEEDRVAGAHPVAVISDAFWRRQFGAAPDILHRTLRLSGITYAVIGVTAPGFQGEWVGTPTGLWVPFIQASLVMPEVPGGPGRFPRRVIGRLKPGITIAQAQPPTQALYRRLLDEEATPGTDRAALDRAAALTLETAAHGYSPQRTAFAQPLAILAAAVGVLLIIACANLANLLLARSAARERELAVRLAIGAGRGRIVRQMLTESAVLAALGAVLGIAASIAIVNTLAGMMAAAPVSLAGQGTGLHLDLHLDLRVLAFATAVAVLVAIGFGVVPALFAARVRLAGSLNDSAARIVSGASAGPSNALVVAQVALSLLLVIAAGLFTRTLANLKAQDLGVERQHELLVWTVPGQTGRQDAAMAELWHTVQQRLTVLPGVLSAAASNQAVLSGTILTPSTTPSIPMRIDGEPVKTATMPGFRSFVTSGYFATLGVPLLAGREFTERDHETAPRVAILNETMARYYFGSRPESAVGRSVRFNWNGRYEIVGVARDFVKGSPRAGARNEFATYFPYRDPEALNRGAQTRLRIMLVLLRTTGDPMLLAETVRRELRAIDPMVPIIRINTTEQQLDDVLAQDRLIAVLSMAFGAVALFLACLGLFGLLSYRVSRRTNEIGVRLALGATPRGIVAMVMGESGRMIAAGLAIGLLATALSGRFVAQRLYGVAVTDALTIAGAVLLLVVVAAVAAFIPARQASSVDPMAALRAE